ncbi:methyl-accepting chemotaxis protein [Roseomonas sp. GC11]|uniref:methyl-accepting chemotaxis protein n=1 Tax=Roseomonas sp. GC11 TaxID=2950546 RepID=UPI00210B3CD0|nr:methyl-accepting chemotaxis protein [Roseomonas sp. GC11]
MRIRTFFLVCFCGVAIPGAIASVWQSLQGWSAWQQASYASLATTAVSDAQRAQTAIAAEVGAYATQLRSDSPSIAAFEQMAPETDRLLRRAVESAASAKLDIGQARQAVDLVSATRQRALADMRRPRATRDNSLPAETQRVRNSGVEAMAALAAAASREVAATAPDAGLILEIANAVMDIRDYAGRRNTVIVNWIIGQPVTQETLELAHQQGGRVEQAWQTAQRLIAAMPRNAALQAAVQEQRRTLEGEAEPRWRQHIALGRQALAGQPVTWPLLPVDNYRAWATPAQAQILALRDVALDQAMLRTATAATAAEWDFFLAALLAVLCVGIALASVLMLMRRVVLPLQGLTGTVGRIADGELELSVPGKARQDELGELAKAVETLRVSSLQRREMEAAQQEGQRAELARAQRVNELLRHFEDETAGVLRAVAAAATEMDATAGSMVEIAANGNNRANAVANASQDASGSVQTVAAAAEELAASIAEVARQVKDSASRAMVATEAAEQTDRTVRGLNDAAGRIGDVVQMISNIASQTNLLALNATIEAARAGESGKGFAVVAGEVKNLASQTAKATEEISAQIASMQAETGRTVQAIGEIARMIRELNEATGTVAEAAGQQAEATQEIGRAVAKAAVGTQEASRHAAGVSEDAERTGRAAEDVRGAASELAQQSEILRGQMDSFLSSLRAA